MNPFVCPRCGVGSVPDTTSAEDGAPGVEWWCDHCDRVWTITVAGAHQPGRPAWTCTADGAVWPCPGARRELLTGFADDQDGLRRYLAALREEAMRDLPGVEPGELTRRFAVTSGDQVRPDQGPA